MFILLSVDNKGRKEVGHSGARSSGCNLHAGAFWPSNRRVTSHSADGSCELTVADGPQRSIGSVRPVGSSVAGAQLRDRISKGQIQ